MLLKMYKNFENMHNRSHKLYVETQFFLKIKKPGGLVKFWKKGGLETGNQLCAAL